MANPSGRTGTESGIGTRQSADRFPRILIQARRRWSDRSVRLGAMLIAALRGSMTALVGKRRRLAGFPIALALCVAVACRPNGDEPGSGSPAPARVGVVFTDVTAEAGIEFVHHNGRSGRKFLPETLGSGCAFLDYNNDGRADIFLVNSRPWTGDTSDVTSKLYRNEGGGRFSDVTQQAGLATPMYGLGVAAPDYDNDGFQDLYVTVLDGDRLFRNRGDGTFEDVTSAAGIDNARFGTSAAWVDYDLDGHLDLFVANYVEWSMEGDLWCSMDGATKTYCTPESYRGQPSALYRNRGDGSFQEVGASAGVADPTAKALGIAILDYDSDGLPRYLPGQRHPAEQALPERRRRHIQRAWDLGRDRVRGGRQGARRDGR